MALTCMLSSRGKTGRAPGARKTLQALKTFLEESLAPFADNLPGKQNLSCDLVVAQTSGGHQDDLGADDLIIREARSGKHCRTIYVTVAGELDRIGTCA